MPIRASYYDGVSSKRHEVELMLGAGIIIVSGDVQRSYHLRQMEVPERLRADLFKLNFADGAYLEMQNPADYVAILSAIGYREPKSVGLTRSWRAVLLSIAIMLAVLVPGYLYGLPAAAKYVSQHMPEQLQRSIGKEALGFLDQKFFQPTALPPERQNVLIERFKSLKLPKQGMPTHEILFRKSKIGPNAFALPSGQIVMTDEMIALLGTDDAVMGVLAHELGHLHERHLLRRIIQGSVVGMVTMVLLGDVSSTVAALPTALLDMKYSRDAEREADDYAIAMMKVNGIPLTGLRQTFEKLGSQSIELNAYLSSHPPAVERIERIRQAELAR